MGLVVNMICIIESKLLFNHKLVPFIILVTIKKEKSAANYN